MVYPGLFKPLMMPRNPFSQGWITDSTLFLILPGTQPTVTFYPDLTHCPTARFQWLVHGFFFGLFVGVYYGCEATREIKEKDKGKGSKKKPGFGTVMFSTVCMSLVCGGGGGSFLFVLLLDCRCP